MASRTFASAPSSTTWTLKKMQKTAAATWDTDLRDKFLIKHSTGDPERWSAAANALFVSVAGSNTNTLLNRNARIKRRNARRLFTATDTTPSERTIAQHQVHAAVFDHNIFLNEATTDVTFAVRPHRPNRPRRRRRD